jgi:transposase InsO family protein
VRWHREGFRRYWSIISKRGKGRGRPAIEKEIRDLILQTARENLTWRAPRIHGELLKLGFEVSERTVSRYMPKRTADEDKMKKWMAFLRNHREVIAAMDFFVVPTLNFCLLYVFFVIQHGRRKILHFNVTFHPTAQWVIQQLREARPYDATPRYLIFDRDTIFSRDVVNSIKSFGIKPVRISYRSPWQNGVAERWILSCRKEMLDHVIAFNEEHLRRLLRGYVSYYNKDRTHYSLQKDSPYLRPINNKPSSRARIVSLARAGGLHHRYEWAEAA